MSIENNAQYLRVELDGDGTGIGLAWPYQPNKISRDRIDCFKEAAKIVEAPVIPLTNRPWMVVEELAKATGCKVGVAESGGVYYVKKERPLLNPVFDDYVHFIRGHLYNVISETIEHLGIQHDIGYQQGTQVTACWYSVDPNQPINQEFIHLANINVVNNPLLRDKVILKSGKNALDVVPADPCLSKELGHDLITQTLYPRSYGRNLPNAIIAIDDSAGAIPWFAKVYDEVNIPVLCTVDNADDDLKLWVDQHHGYISPHKYEEGTYDALCYARDNLVNLPKKRNIWSF